MKTSILTKKTGAGHFNVEVMKDHELVGSFNTTDMQLIDDITILNTDRIFPCIFCHQHAICFPPI